MTESEHPEEVRKMRVWQLRWMTTALVVIACSGLSAQLALAADPSGDPDEWEFSVIPYAWLVGIHGDVTVAGMESSVDMAFADLWDDLDFAGQLHGEAAKGKLALFLDGTWVKLSDRDRIGPVTVDIDFKLGIVEFGGTYRVLTRGLGGAASARTERELTVELLAGGRYWYLKPELNVKPLGVEFERSKDWVDAMVGARLNAELTDRTSLWLRADVGGFDIGSSSEFSFNGIGGIRYRFADRWRLNAGYRVMTLDYGSGRQSFKADLVLYGPLLGVEFRF